MFSGAKQHAEKAPFSSNNQEKHTSVAKATTEFIGLMPGINPRPTAQISFSAGREALSFLDFYLIRNSQGRV
jgi:hypothetical protein